MKHCMPCRLALALLLCALVLPLSCSAAEQPGKYLKKGTLISLMGDSISTYAGWSDQRPILAPDCTNPYGLCGEAYYGPKGGDYQNTDYLVTDTWWHQAATQMGATILVNSSSNSSGLIAKMLPPPRRLGTISL